MSVAVTLVTMIASAWYWIRACCIPATTVDGSDKFTRICLQCQPTALAAARTPLAIASPWGIAW
jgi:hypothetical protein